MLRANRILPIGLTMSLLLLAAPTVLSQEAKERDQTAEQANRILQEAQKKAQAILLQASKDAEALLQRAGRAEGMGDEGRLLSFVEQLQSDVPATLILDPLILDLLRYQDEGQFLQDSGRWTSPLSALSDYLFDLSSQTKGQAALKQAKRNLDELQKQLAQKEQEVFDLKERTIELRKVLADRKAEDPEGSDFRDVLVEFNRTVGEIKKREVEMQRIAQEQEVRYEEVELLKEDSLREAERRDLNTMMHRMEYVATWQDVAYDPRRAVTMATQAIVEIQFGVDKPQEALERLEKLVSETRDTGTDTAIRFAMKDIYMAMGDTQKAADQLGMIIRLNAKAIDQNPFRERKIPQ